jgi:hypothetical protein
MTENFTEKKSLMSLVIIEKTSVKGIMVAMQVQILDISPPVEWTIDNQAPLKKEDISNYRHHAKRLMGKDPLMVLDFAFGVSYFDLREGELATEFRQEIAKSFTQGFEEALKKGKPGLIGRRIYTTLAYQDSLMPAQIPALQGALKLSEYHLQTNEPEKAFFYAALGKAVRINREDRYEEGQYAVRKQLDVELARARRKAERAWKTKSGKLPQRFPKEEYPFTDPNEGYQLMAFVHESVKKSSNLSRPSTRKNLSGQSGVAKVI